MKTLKAKVVWITGASSGIGEALAVAFAREGAFPVLSARNAEKLEEVKQRCLQHTAQCWVQPIDLMNIHDIEKTVQAVLDRAGRIDVLVNNAGRSQRSLATETPLENDRHIMELNFFSPVALTKRVLPHMLQQQSGHIVAISSIAGKFGYPWRTAYSASKHALQGFFESLRTELTERNIKITIASPGQIKTAISLSALTSSGEAYNKMDAAQAQGMVPEQCAHKIIKAVKRERKEVLVGKKEILMVYIRRFIPALYYKMVKLK